MPPTRREQLELDELLSDIYRGIETLPDNKSQQVYASSNKSLGGNTNLSSRTYTREYELPASSPLVKQHKQELAALRSAHNNSNASNASNNFTSNKPSKSTLKRHTKTYDQQPKSLAAFVTSSTPENKRRVRIFDHPDKLAKGYSSNEEADYNDFDSARLGGEKQRPGSKVKYVNTNKLIYHQERNPDDQDSNYPDDLNNNNQDDDDDDIDGVSRVEYYHTTWLDRQLGRASKRRSSKELNERQVKEKAMIEELKQSLKNGAITLRQSFKGKRSNQSGKQAKPSGTHDDQMLTLGRNSRKIHESSSSSVFGSGLATIPRNYQANVRNNSASRQEREANNNYTLANSSTVNTNTVTPKQTNAPTSDHRYPAPAAPQLTSSSTNTHQFDSVYKPAEDLSGYQQELPKQPNYSSTTLPHNHQPNIEGAHHSLLQSHYRGGKNFNTLGNLSGNKTPVGSNTIGGHTMRDDGKICGIGRNYGAKSPINNQYNKQQEQEQYQLGNTISSIPSATDVVRSALSRSSSQISLNQLNKTINLLPNSPPPYAPSPMTPTQQLKAASPSLSPSPARSPYQRQQDNLICHKPATPNAQYLSKTLDTRTNQPQLSGTRTIGRVLPHQQQQQQQQQHQPYQYQQPQQQSQHQNNNQQPIYANPHASLMQHRMEQQVKGPSRNTASIREFNELDSLLRSLSPGSAAPTTNVTPGFTSKPAQPSFGYGFSPAQQSMPNNQTSNQPKSDIVYAQVQKQNPPHQQPASNYYKPNEQSRPANYLQSNYGSNNLTAPNEQPFTIDVTNKRDENCLQRQDISEFEPPIELVPSMEDYQNISKLNPVKNHYWYKPNMSRDRAINLLKDKPQGTFIVRDSTSFRGAYGLAVKVSKLPKNVLNNASLRNPNGDPSAELIRHFLIEPTSSGVRLKGYANEPVFGSLPALIYQHSLMELALPCKLVIPRADIEDQKFNHKQKQFYDDFIASKEQAKHNPYDRTSPNNGYRRYPGDVYVHNEHRIIFE